MVNYKDELAKKLQELKAIDGFPEGQDFDILALSKPPFYTACPNPFIDEFINCKGKPYDEKTDNYHREPFVGDVSEGKNDPIYNAHSYHTKVPHKAIIKYIEHYTEEGDIILDGFCATGMTGVAAKLTNRFAILSDLSPIATFIAANYNSPAKAELFEKDANDLLSELEQECSWLYDTNTHINLTSKKFNPQIDIYDGIEETYPKGIVNYTVWSDVFYALFVNQNIYFGMLQLIVKKVRFQMNTLAPPVMPN